MNTPRTHDVEVVVAGGGPVGLLAAALFVADDRTRGINVRILDAARIGTWSADNADLRVYALSRASQRLLEKLGVWDQLQSRRVSPYRTMRVWEGDDTDGPASICFEAAEIGEPDLGHIVEDSLLRDRLLDFLNRQTNVDVWHEVVVESVEQNHRKISVQTSAGESLRADLLIGADGANSRVRDQLGISVMRHDYEQRAIVAHIASSKSHCETAWQRFLATGPLAFLPLIDGRSSIVWSLPETEAARLIALSEKAFERELEAASTGVLGDLKLTSARASFALRMLHAIDYCRQSVVLVGDAAHSVHPLAGQGLNLGFIDAACLVDVLANAVERGDYLGDRFVLERYVRMRKAHNLSMQLAFDALDRTFRLPAWTAHLRTLGLMGVNHVAAIKRSFMTQAMGLDRLPESYTAMVGE